MPVFFAQLAPEALLRGCQRLRIGERPIVWRREQFRTRRDALRPMLADEDVMAGVDVRQCPGFELHGDGFVNRERAFHVGVHVVRAAEAVPANRNRLLHDLLFTIRFATMSTMSDEISKAASALGRKGGQSKSKRKLTAAQKNLAKAWENRWPNGATAEKKVEITPGRRVSRQRFYQLKYPERYQARRKARKLPMQPCEKCGSTTKVHRHHDDYSKPLEVRWLCHEHHKQADREQRKKNKR